MARKSLCAVTGEDPRLIRSLRSLATLAALAVALLTLTEDADARLAGGLGIRSRGARVFVLPQLASVMLNTAAPMGRAMTAQAGPSSRGGGSLAELFNRPGWLGGFAAGFLGAGLLGVAFGQGMFGELVGVTSFLGLLFQLALVVMLGRLIWIRCSRHNATGYAGLSPRQQAEPYLRSRNELLPGIYPLEGQESATADAETISSAAFSAGTAATRGVRKG